AGVVAGDGAAGSAHAVQVQPASRRRAPGDETDAANDLFVLGVAGEPAGRHGVRLAAGAGGAVLAVLLRSFDRAAAGVVRRRHWHGHPAAAVADARRPRWRRLFALARLGIADGA